MRLQQLQTRMVSQTNIEGSTPEEVRASIRTAFEQMPDAPVSAARGIQTLLDDLHYSHLPGVNQAIVQLLEMTVRETADTILALSIEGFSEAVWARADTLFSLMEKYLDALTLYEQLQTIDG